MIVLTSCIFAVLLSVVTAEFKAVAYVAGPGVQGNLQFSQADSNSPVRITGTISGLTPNALQGFHIHEKGDVTNNCIAAGGHFNPYKKAHGAPTDVERHAGDLGNIQVGLNGVAVIDISDSIISLCPASETSILGRGVVVHAGTDDLGLGGESDSKTTGHAGARVACGVIGIVASEKCGACSLLTLSPILLLFIAISQLFFS